jgi:phosphoribosyl 1,2-cyclic phosphodiesterase
MVQICSLASGSNGNCYYIGNENEAILIDAGIHYNQLIVRLKDAGLDKNKIKAIFISHEHSDHILGIRAISKKLNAPGIFSKRTFFKIADRWKPDSFSFFIPGQECNIGDIAIYPFIKKHDAAEPCSFRVELEGKNIGVLTDIGQTDETLQHEFSKCNAVFLESNYDRDMLWNGNYPYILKRRVDSDLGHLSNTQALDLTKEFASPLLKTIFLSHISASNNTIELVMKNFSVLNGRFDIKIASRHGISEIVNL